MRRSNLIILLVALAMGGIAALMARSWIAQHTTAQPVASTSTILVAAAPLAFGTVLTEDNVSEIPWAEPQLPEGAFAKKIDLLREGRRVVLTAMERSEMITRPKVTAPGQRASLSVLLEEGQRAVTSPCASTTSGVLRDSSSPVIGSTSCCSAPRHRRARPKTRPMC